ncbi:MAG: UDP-N-acetylmuramate dehydrogenase [Flavobacteriaceae bacterium]|nr:UDP-N-acetylmuramate dehydrogenase [Flavobacteriaceae bacterium]
MKKPVIHRNYPLKAYNTFGIDVTADRFVEVRTLEDLQAVLTENKDVDIFVLGGGSNLLLTKNVTGLVIFLNLKGIQQLQSHGEITMVEVAAGEVWHDFVLWTLAHNLGGIENLSLIPGSVGAAPIQNIGAYGVELKDVFESCTAISIDGSHTRTFTAADCQFGYRSSVFKLDLKQKYIIVSVQFRLKNKDHLLHTSYGNIQAELDKMRIAKPSIQDISKAVIAIRSSKLPNPKEIGNSGSFFKNPVISQTHFDSLKTAFPDIPGYLNDSNLVKVPAGWLIEQCGFKGIRQGDAGVHDKQALVLVNHGNATGAEILSLAIKIQEKVFKTFKIQITPEVNVYA